jgi:hypothetical protein
MALRFIETDIVINAPATKVWKVLSDLERWPEWHPFVSGVKGSLAKGERILLHKGTGERSITVTQTVVRVEPGSEFRLAGKLGVKGLLDNEHRFSIEQIDDETTRFLHGQAFRGPLVRMLIRKRGQASYEVSEQINEALKERVESESR